MGRGKEAPDTLSDDVNDNLAFRELDEAVGEDPVVVRSRNKYVGILVKPAGLPREAPIHPSLVAGAHATYAPARATRRAGS